MFVFLLLIGMSFPSASVGNPFFLIPKPQLGNLEFWLAKQGHSKQGKFSEKLTLA